MGQVLEGMIRDAYAAFGRGDLDGYLGACTEDFVFHVPGKGAMSGTYRGKLGLYELAGKVGGITQGTFREEVKDVLANDQHAVVIACHELVRNGDQKEYWTAHVYRIRGGKLAECWEQPREQAVFDDAWG